MGQSRSWRAVRMIAVLSCLSLTMTACDADEVLKLLDDRAVGQDLPVTTSADLATAMDRIEDDDATGRRAGGEPGATPRPNTRTAPKDAAPGQGASKGSGSKDTASKDSGSKSTASRAAASEDTDVTDDRGPADDAVSALERQIFDLLNDTREQAGQHALARRAGMSEGAREWSCEMARTGEFHHADLRAVGVNGENIAWGQRSAEEVHEDWMNSPGHRDNRMNARWTEYGVGVCTNGSGQLHYTERFR